MLNQKKHHDGNIIENSSPKARLVSLIQPNPQPLPDKVLFPSNHTDILHHLSQIMWIRQGGTNKCPNAGIMLCPQSGKRTFWIRVQFITHLQVNSHPIDILTKLFPFSDRFAK